MSRQEVSVGEITSLVTKGTTPTTYGMPFVDSGINFVKAEALNGDTSLDHSGFNFIDTETYDKLARSQLKENDVLMTIAGANVGKCGLVRPGDLPANTNQAVGIMRVVEELADPRYVYYHFKQPSTRSLCLSIGGQSAQPNVNLTNLKAFKISLPDRLTQTRVADVLSTYDDLIENNRRRIVLLAEAARLLYREWFVHFRFPGAEHVKVVDGVPEGWEQGTISEIFNTSSGGTPSRKKAAFYVGGEINWLKTKELNNGYIFGTEEKITDEAVKRSSAKLFPKNTVIVAMYGATIGQLGILAEPSTTNQACCALLPKVNDLDFLFGFLLMQDKFEVLRDLGQGSAQNNVSQKVIQDFKIIIPPRDLLDDFNETVRSFFDQKRILENSIPMLAKARDLLLPRLMDGRLEI